MLAHLIHGECGFQNYIGEVVGEQESHYDEFPANQQFRNEATLAVYPTLSELRQELNRAFQETAELYAHLPENFPAHKSSYWRLAYAGLENPFHYQVHLKQMQAALQATREK